VSSVLEDPDDRLPLESLYRAIELVLEWSGDELAHAEARDRGARDRDVDPR
jgi:hypothetical protein